MHLIFHSSGKQKRFFLFHVCPKITLYSSAILFFFLHIYQSVWGLRVSPVCLFSIPISCPFTCLSLSLSPPGHFLLRFLCLSFSLHFLTVSASSSHPLLLNSITFLLTSTTILICFFTEFVPLSPPSPHSLHTHLSARANTHFSLLCRLVIVEVLECLADGHVCVLSNLLLCQKENTYTNSCMYTQIQPTNTHLHSA